MWRVDMRIKRLNNLFSKICKHCKTKLVITLITVKLFQYKTSDLLRHLFDRWSVVVRSLVAFIERRTTEEIAITNWRKYG